MAPPNLLVRPARAADLDGLFRLASEASAGLTNLPADRAALALRILASTEAFEQPAARAEGSPLLFVVDRGGQVAGTACIFPRIGVEWPFYSYRITRQAQTSKALGKKIVHDVLMLANDFDGHAEVGGLFVDEAARGTAAGRLAARSRYLFMAVHRDWFGERVISDLRGYQAHGKSPVWEALGQVFYSMGFAEADHTNGVHGNQFISDLAPKHPIYTSLLPVAARDALGRPHDEGRRAHAWLLEEGFRFDGYVDIFDGGPTLAAAIDDLRAVREFGRAVVVRVRESGEMHMVCVGIGAAFRAAFGRVTVVGDLAEIEPALASVLGVVVGDTISHVPF